MAPRAGELRVGQVFEAVVVDDLRRTQIVQYAGAGGDFNPLHTDHIFAVEVGGNPRGTFAHGMLTMGMTGRLLTDTFGVDHLRKFGGRFTAQVWPGDTLKASAEITEIREERGEYFVDMTLTTTNQNASVVFTGSATARIDP